MAIKIKQKDEIWTLYINETFGYDDLKKLETDLGILLDFKKNHGQVKQMLRAQEAEKQKAEEDEFKGKLTTMTDRLKKIMTEDE